MTRIGWLVVVVAVVLAGALGGCGVTRRAVAHISSASSQTVVRTGRSAAPRRGSFLSVWPACACGRRTVLERFSLSDGHPLGTLARLPTGPGVQISPPHALPGGPVWLTISTGPKYRSGVAGGDPAPNSCSGVIEHLDPTTGTSTSVLTLPSSVLITDAVPSPRGRLVVMPGGGCATSFLNQHLTIENLRTHRRWTIGADAAPCHVLSDAAWSPNGSLLVFPYGPSVLSPHTHYVPHGTCEAPRFGRLVVVPSGHSTPVSAWKLITADSHCSYIAATFDRWGIAAIEGCTTGAPAGQGNNPDLGNAYLVQLDPRRREVLRLRLDRGFNEGGIAADPQTGNVLLSEYQAANQGISVHNTVWAFNGRQLRVIHRYANQDAPTVIAQPW